MNNVNLCPEALKFFQERPHIVLKIDSRGNVWEQGKDLWHPEAFLGTGPSVESLMCSQESFEKAGPRKNVWFILDHWANIIGQSAIELEGWEDFKP